MGRVCGWISWELELTIPVQIGAKQFTLKEAGEVVYIMFCGKTYTLRVAKSGEGLILM